MLEEPEKTLGFTHPIRGPKTIKIAIKDAKEIIERVAKENNFKMTDKSYRVDWPPTSSQLLECLQITFFKGEYLVSEYVLFTVDKFWDTVEKVTLNAIKELNKCLKDPKTPPLETRNPKCGFHLRARDNE